ncbi:hypothetical protein GCM10027446_33770 [Angustibacter peucedani]
MHVAALPGEQPRSTSSRPVAADGYGDPDHDDADAVGVDPPVSPPPQEPVQRAARGPASAASEPPDDEPS